MGAFDNCIYANLKGAVIIVKRETKIKQFFLYFLQLVNL